MTSTSVVCVSEASKELIQLKAKMQIYLVYGGFKDDGFPCYPSLQMTGLFT